MCLNMASYFAQPFGTIRHASELSPRRLLADPGLDPGTLSYLNPVIMDLVYGVNLSLRLFLTILKYTITQCISIWCEYVFSLTHKSIILLCSHCVNSLTQTIECSPIHRLLSSMQAQSSCYESTIDKTSKWFCFGHALEQPFCYLLSVCHSDHIIPLLCQQLYSLFF